VKHYKKQNGHNKTYSHVSLQKPTLTKFTEKQTGQMATFHMNLLFFYCMQPYFGYNCKYSYLSVTALGMQASTFGACPSPGWIGRVATGRASGIKMGDEWDEGGWPLISPDGVALSWIVGVSASDISPCTMKSRGSFLLAPAHPGSAGKRAIKRCVCVCVCACIQAQFARHCFQTCLQC